MVGDIVVTRRNDRQLRTTAGEPVRNRERWTITHTAETGEITVSRIGGHGTITLPADYVRDHVQLAYASTEYGAQGDTADRSITLATTATSGRGLYVGMTRGRDENLALVADTADPRTSDRCARSSHRHRPRRHPRHHPTPDTRRCCPTIQPTATSADPGLVPRPPSRRRTASTRRPSCRRRPRPTASSEQRAANERRYADACRGLPAAEAAHAPFHARVVDAEDVVTEARSNVWNAERDLRNAGKLGRRSARRGVEAANGVLAVAEERLARCEQAAEPTGRPLSKLRDIVDYHDRIQSTRDMLDDWTNLDAHADRAEHLSNALDQWKHWANGHHLPVEQLSDVIAVLEDDRTINGTNRLAEATRHWAQETVVDLPRRQSQRPDHSIELGIDL
jgi:hypothetical protein